MKFDVVVIGGGLAGMTAAMQLQKAGLKTAVFSAGRSIHNVPYREFEAAGGVLFMDNAVQGGEFSDGRLASVRAEKFPGIPVEASSFVLATGKYFSRGIAADMDRVYETVFGLDVRYDEVRDNWFGPKFADAQPFMMFGVSASPEGNVSKDGKTVGNLYAAGEVLAGLDPTAAGAEESIKDGALKVADRIVAAGGRTVKE